LIADTIQGQIEPDISIYSSIVTYKHGKGDIMVFLIIFGGLIGLGLLAWILINTFAIELHEPKNEEHRPH